MCINSESNSQIFLLIFSYILLKRVLNTQTFTTVFDICTKTGFTFCILGFSDVPLVIMVGILLGSPP